MTQDTAQHDERYVALATKVRRSSAILFNRLCKKKGLNKYKVIQMFVDVWIRYTDDRHNLSQEMAVLMSLFEHGVGWKDAFNLADPTAEPSIEQAVYILTAKEQHGARAVMVSRPFFGNWSETFNLQNIMERTVEVLVPELYRRLRTLAIDMDCNSILELLFRLADEYSNDADMKSIRQEFEDARRHDFGKEVEFGQRTKRVPHSDPDIFAQQEAKRVERKAQQASEYLNKNMDFRPFGGEW